MYTKKFIHFIIYPTIKFKVQIGTISYMNVYAYLTTKLRTASPELPGKELAMLSSLTDTTKLQ